MSLKSIKAPVIYKFQAKIMPFSRCHSLLILFCLNIALWGFIPVAFALKLPNELKLAVAKVLPSARIRMDGSIESKNGSIYLALVPIKPLVGSKPEARLKTAFPNKSAPLALLFDNGWCFLKVISVGQQRTFNSLKAMPQDIQQAIISAKLTSDLIVPDHFVLPVEMKAIGGNVAVTVKDVASENKGEDLANVAKSNMAHSANSDVEKNGTMLVTSPATGKVSLLTYPDLSKIIEFPMEGTPSGAAFANGKVYIADQSKARVLKLDPYHKLFLGQIDLPKGSVPKDVAAIADGRLIYVSENMFSDVAVFETDSDKLLVRTKVNSYPGKMAVTPDGKTLLILSVPDSKISMLSTQNQRFLGTIAVGSLPSGIAINDNSKIAYISNRVSNTVSVVDLLRHTVVLTLKTGIGPTGIVVGPGSKKLYVANAKDNSITIFDLSNYKKIDDIKLPLEVDFPNSLTLLPDNKHILVSSASTDSLGFFDITTQTFEKMAAIGHSSDQCLWIPAN